MSEVPKLHREPTEGEREIDNFLAQFNTPNESSQSESGGNSESSSPEATNPPEGSPSPKPEHEPTFSTPELHEYEINRIERHLGQSALIATRLNEDDRKNVMAEAIDLKAKQDINKSKVKTILTRLPLVGSVVRAGYMSKYKKTVEKAINEHSNLSDAYEALGLNVADSQVINSDNEAAAARAQQIFETGYTDEGGNKFSRLDSNDRIEKVDASTQSAVKAALNEYYAGLKNSGNKEELSKAFKEQINAALANEKDSGTLKDAIMKQQANLESLAKDDSVQANKVKAYLENHLALYSATMKEGLYTKKKVDAISAAVVAGGLAGGVIAALSTREISKAVRGVATAAGTTNVIAGAAAGGITGAIRGWQKAGVKLSDAEIKATAGFAEPSSEAPQPTIDPSFIGPQPAESAPDSETNPGPNPDAANSDKAKKKASLFATLERIGKKATGEEKYTQEINELRKRKSANSLISELDDLISQGGPEDRQKLEDLYAEIRARGQLSADKNIDLIIYGKDEAGNDNRSKLEQKLAEAELALFGDLYGDQASINEKLQMPGAPINGKIEAQYAELMKDYDKARSLETKFKLRSAAVNGIMGALTGAGAGAVFRHIHETKAFETAVSAAKEKVEGVASFGVGEVINEFKGHPVVIEDNGDYEGVSVGFDMDGDGSIDNYLYNDTEGTGIDLTDKSQFNQLHDQLQAYGMEIQSETVDTSRYSEVSVGEYLNSHETVDNSGGVDWGRSATRVAFGNPSVEVGDGMDTYEVPVWGVNGNAIPDGAKLYIDLDGDNGPGEALEFTIENGKAIVPADVLDTSHVGNGGAANFIGTARVGEMDGNTMISYATSFGKDADLSTTISAPTGGEGVAFTVTDAETGEGLSQFAVRADGSRVSNLSEIFNGETKQLPSTFIVNDIDDNAAGTTLASGETIVDLDYKGGYHSEFDSFENEAFIESKSYLGTPIHWDQDGDGYMNAEEEASYFRQMLVRTGTNKFMLGQNASNYGLLDRNRLTEIIPEDTLTEWGIADGQVDNEAELNLLLDHITQPENAEHYDNLVNATINEMEQKMQGGSFSVETVTDRISTYANSDRQLDTAPASIGRTAIFAYDAEGNSIGNQGWWARKYGFEGGRVGNMPNCNQILGEKPTKTTGEGTKTTGESTTKTTTEKTTSEKNTGEKTTGEKTTREKNTSEKTTEEKTTEEKTTEEKTTEEKTTEEKTTEEKTTEEKTTEESNNHTPKNEEAERVNAGDRVDQQPLDETVTPKTTETEVNNASRGSDEQVKNGDMAGSSEEKATQSAVDNSAETAANNQASSNNHNSSAAQRAAEVAKNEQPSGNSGSGSKSSSSSNSGGGGSSHSGGGNSSGGNSGGGNSGGGNSGGGGSSSSGGGGGGSDSGGDSDSEDSGE